MANTFRLKRSSVAAKVPATGDLQLGELALNTFDGKLYTKKDNGTATIVEIGAGSGGGTTFTASSSAPGSPSAGDEWLDTDNGILYTYVNDGNSSQWVELGAPGLVASGGAGVTDGDKGDITVSGTGSTWTIDNGVVGTTKLGGDITTAGKALLDDADAAAQRTTLGLGTLATQSGTFSGTSSGTNTGDQTITLTGDVTGSGTGSFAATLANSGVTAGTYNNSATAITPITVDAKGRVTSTGSVVTITPSFASITSKPTTLAGYGITDAQPLDATLTALAGVTTSANQLIYATASDTFVATALTAFGRGLIDDADAAAGRTTLGLGTLATQSGTFSGSSSGTNTGDQNVFTTIAVSGQSNVAADAASDTLTLVAGSNVTITTDAATDTITIAASGGGGISDGDKGDITVSGSGATWTVDANVITNAKLAQVATGTFKGRTTASTGNVEDLTATQATAGLDTFTSSLKGLAPASGGGTTNFLRADGTWAAPAGGGGGSGVLRLTFFAGTSGVWTNMPAAAALFFGNTGFIQKADLTNYTECRLMVNKTGVAAQTGAILELEYSTTYTQTAASYSQIGTTAASVGVAVQNQYLDSGWQTLASGAQAHVFLTIIGVGGNGTLDPTFGHVIAEFR